MSKVAVVGAGAWGTALAIQASRAGQSVDLVARDAAAVAEIGTGRRSKRLPGARLPQQVGVCERIDRRADLVIWAVPMQQLRASLLHFRPSMDGLLLCAKGVEAGSGKLPLEVAGEVLGPGSAAVLSGPNFAVEIAKGAPAASVVAAADGRLRRKAADLLGTKTFRLYGNNDPTGVQLCGAAKNVIAIAAGAVTGARLGENARAGLVTRALGEIRRLVEAQGGRAETVTGLSGLGDLLLTCTSASSRNFSLGLALGGGTKPADLPDKRGATIEGVATAHALVERAGPVELPICRAVAGLLDGKKTLEQAVEELLARPRRDE